MKLEEIKKILPRIYKRKIITEDDIEIALGWLRGEVTHGQLAKGLKLYGSNVYNYLCMSIREAKNKGRLIIK